MSSKQYREDIKAVGGKMNDSGINLPYLRVHYNAEVPSIFVIGVHTTHGPDDATYGDLYRADAVHYARSGVWDEKRIRSIKSTGIINPVSVTRVHVDADDEDWPDFARGTTQFAVLAGRHRVLDGGELARRMYAAGEISSVDALHCPVVVKWRVEGAQARAIATDENVFARRMSPLEIGQIVVDNESRGIPIEETCTLPAISLKPSQARNMARLWVDGCPELHRRVYDGTIPLMQAVQISRMPASEQPAAVDAIPVDATSEEAAAVVASKRGKVRHKPPTPKVWRKIADSFTGQKVADYAKREREISLISLAAGTIGVDELPDDLRDAFKAAAAPSPSSKGED